MAPPQPNYGGRTPQLWRPHPQLWQFSSGTIITGLVGSMLAALVAATFIAAWQATMDSRRRFRDQRYAMVRRLRYVASGKEIIAPPIEEDEFHLFLSHRQLHTVTYRYRALHLFLSDRQSSPTCVVLCSAGSPPHRPPFPPPPNVASPLCTSPFVEHHPPSPVPPICLLCRKSKQD